MWPTLRRVVLGSAACLLLAGGAVDAQIRPDKRFSRDVRLSTSQVTIFVTPADFDLATGEAVVLVPRSIRGDGWADNPWVIRVHSPGSFSSGWSGPSGKPCGDLSIRASDGFYFRPLTPTDRPVKWGTDTHGRIEFYFDLQLTARLTDNAGEHSLVLFFDLQR